jgi:membrane glycosyltransferase
MLQHVARRQGAVEGLPMPDQILNVPFTDNLVPDIPGRTSPTVARLILFGFPATFLLIVATILVLAFRSDGQLLLSETILIVLMAVLCGWEAMPSANAVLGLFARSKPHQGKEGPPLSIAILATMRDECAQDVIPKKLELLRAFQGKTRHGFDLHVLSDSKMAAHIENEKRLVHAARPLPVFYSNRPVNRDFKSGNIRNWVENNGAAYDAFIILDADSEMDSGTAVALSDMLSADKTCALIQTIPIVQHGHTIWQNMQSLASRLYGSLQGHGHAVWMGNEANYYGHNAIIRTKAFAASAGLPRLNGRGLWNGPILSHDFVEAALLRRAGWTTRLLPTETGSYEQAPVDVIAYLRRDARWCLGNFQHSRVLGSAGFHPVSRFHFLGGIFTYLSSAMWMITLLLWGIIDVTQIGVGGFLAISAFLLIATNLLLPRVLGVICTIVRKPEMSWLILTEATKETLFSSLFAPSLMVQRVMIMGRVLSNQSITWAQQHKATRSLPDCLVFHVVEVLVGLGLLACVERGFLTAWFLLLGVCLALTPLLSWFSAQPIRTAHENLNGKTPL